MTRSLGRSGDWQALRDERRPAAGSVTVAGQAGAVERPRFAAVVAVPGLVFDGSATAVGAGERAGERAGDVVGGPVSSVRGFGRLVSRVAPAGGSGVLRRAVVAQVEVGADP